MQIHRPTPQATCNGSIFAFECGSNYSVYQNWLDTHHEQCIGSIVAYLGFIYLGQKAIADRKPLRLERTLFLWNISLAVFSMIGAYRFIEEFVQLHLEGGYHRLLCNKSIDTIRSFWTFAFAISKILEFGDTVFLILRKRPVIFLHWYHHITVLLFTWHASVQQAAFGRLFILMNYIVHSIMYTYYALASIGIRSHRVVSMSITALQILQMVGGLAAVLYVRSQLLAGNSCDVGQGIITSALVMYGSYFILFVKFFVDAYIFKRRKTVKKAATSAKSSCSSSSSSPSLSNGFVGSPDTSLRESACSSSASKSVGHQSPTSDEKHHDSNFNFYMSNTTNGKSKCL